jgi:ferredoxin-thioredoxin reductase catalytic chain
MKLVKDYGKTLAFARMVAEKQGWITTGDGELLSVLVEGLTKNYNRYGYFLCPCRDTDGSRPADADIICPCVFARPDIVEFGHCYCGLYLSEAFRASGRTPSPIPERRYRT